MSGDVEPENGNRATIALVSSQVTGLQELMRAELGAVQRQLDAVVGLPLIVNGMLATIARLDDEMGDMDGLVDRVARLEDSDSSQLTAMQQKRAYRSGTLPIILLTLFGTLLTLASVVIAYVALNQ